MEDESADISRWYAASMAAVAGSVDDHDRGDAGGFGDGPDDG